MSKTAISRCWLLTALNALLLSPILTANNTCHATNSTSAPELASLVASSSPTPVLDSRFLLMEPRSGNSKDDDGDSNSSLQQLGPGSNTKAGSELALNLGATFKLRKKNDEQPQSQQRNGSVGTRPTSNVLGPIISPRYKLTRGSTQKPKPVQHAANRDSYLDALEKSHAIRHYQQLGRREYTPGPVYRGPEYHKQEEKEHQKHDSSPSSSNFVETEVKSSKLPHPSSVDIVPSKSWSPSPSDTIGYSHKQQLPQFSSYHSFDPDAEYQSSHKYPSTSTHSQQTSSKPSHQISYTPFEANTPSISLSPASEILYETPQISYGSPQISYGPPPSSSYGPPHVSYGHHPQGSYGPSQDYSTERLLPLTSMVFDSIKHYEDLNKNKTNPKPCTGLECQMTRSLFFDDTWSDYLRLFRIYAAEEQAIAEQNQNERTRRR
ncbi:hypothetical protein QAD02_017693 [Eretmocerus hayati]|uniref:Uncharacterized protein n=1 Tax=Eretmocerus hayati TaxID=131215 RepID=A0ACC2PFV2_9HYME|nr:hypothetical protein QAD02_017693 [Eretmocerus hayati]